ncbi:MAG TPA: hypothetical protein VKN99_23560 [Polyangia bacterium]|nr:hypothetical protein [Polyangia bacterium]
MTRSSESKAVCFNCRFIEAGAQLKLGARCPRCNYPLILNTGPVALGGEDLDRIFRLLADPYARRGRDALPGITAPRRARPRLLAAVKTPAPEPQPAAQPAQPAPAPASARVPVSRPVAAAAGSPVRAAAQTRPDGTRTSRVLDARRPRAPRRRWLLA